MITFLTTFKAFDGGNDVRQRNALASWLSLDEMSEVFVFGLPEVPSDLRQEARIRCFPKCNWRYTGMPTVRQAIEFGERFGRNGLLAYVNGDIVIERKLVEVLKLISFQKYLAIGERWDSDILEPIPDGTPSEVGQFISLAKKSGGLRGPGGLDYFIFPKATLPHLPGLVPGGIMWDNFMIHHAWEHGIPVVDITGSVDVIHQNHNYGMVASGERELEVGPAAKNNLSIAASSHEHCCTITPGTTLDSQYRVERGKLRRTVLIPRYSYYRFKKAIKRSCFRAGLYKSG